MIAFAVGLGVHRFAALRRFGNTVADDQEQVQPDKQEDDTGNKEDVIGKEPAQSCATDRVTGHNEFCQRLPNKGGPSSLVRTYDNRPESGLVPAQKLPGKAHTQGTEEQYHAAQPVYFAGELEGPDDKDVEGVRAYQQHHGRAAPEVHTAQETTKGHFLGNKRERVVGVTCR